MRIKRVRKPSKKLIKFMEDCNKALSVESTIKAICINCKKDMMQTTADDKRILITCINCNTTVLIER